MEQRGQEEAGRMGLARKWSPGHGDVPGPPGHGRWGLGGLGAGCPEV